MSVKNDSALRNRRMDLTVLTEGRACDGCTVCCHVSGVEALGKPYNCNCRHQTDTGCSIYEKRPEECATARCLWLQGNFSSEWRPDRCGFYYVLTQHEKEPGKAWVECFEVWEHSREERSEALQRLDFLYQAIVEPVVVGCRFYKYGYKIPAAYPTGPDYIANHVPIANRLYSTRDNVHLLFVGTTTDDKIPSI